MKDVLFSFLFAIATFIGFSQNNGKQIEQQNCGWIGYNNTLKINEKYLLLTEVEERRIIEKYLPNQSFVRTQIQKKLSENWQMGVGFAYFIFHVNSKEDEYLFSFPENRPFIELDGKNKLIERLTLTHRYKLEERFIKKNTDTCTLNGYTFNHRFRYKLGIEYILLYFKQNPLTVKLSDEILINTGKTILYNRFDQNRIYLGFNYALNSKLNFELGYLNWYQQKNSGFEFLNRNILKFTLYHKINLS